MIKIIAFVAIVVLALAGIAGLLALVLEPSIESKTIGVITLVLSVLTGKVVARRYFGSNRTRNDL